MLVWFSLTPIGTGSASVSGDIARALDAVEATGIPMQTDPSGTLLEGTWEECMAAMRVAGDAVLEQAERVSFVCKFDIRTDKPQQRGADKLASLAAKRRDGGTGKRRDGGSGKRRDGGSDDAGRSEG